jgi:hypothetical protein
MPCCSWACAPPETPLQGREASGMAGIQSGPANGLETAWKKKPRNFVQKTKTAR